MKKTKILSFILVGVGLVFVSSGCHKSQNTVSSGKSTNTMHVVKKTDQKDTLLLPLEIKPEEIYDRVPVQVEKQDKNK